MKIFRIKITSTETRIVEFLAECEHMALKKVCFDSFKNQTVEPTEIKNDYEIIKVSEVSTEGARYLHLKS